ncbi:MAG: helix-turn-helix transcriptional regulator [Armatimonadetes bacterium]|nr:helix-turn-helix transcriptional regulator [Armatimonadota bacterium]
MLNRMEALARRAEQLRALADPLRLRIVGLLAAHGETCVCEILAETGTTQGNISTHLRVLRSAGLIRSQKIGKWVFYALERQALDELTGWLGGHLAGCAEGCASSLYACCAKGEVPLSWDAAHAREEVA